MLKKENEHVFPFELMEYFDLISVSELGDITTKTEFHEIILREKDTAFEANRGTYYEPRGYLTKRLADFPMQGKPVVIEIQRRLWRHKQFGLKRCKSLAAVVGNLQLKTSIKDFLVKEIQLPEIISCQAIAQPLRQFCDNQVITVINKLQEPLISQFPVADHFVPMPLIHVVRAGYRMRVLFAEDHRALRITLRAE